MSSDIVDSVVAEMMLNGIHGKLSGAGGDGGVVLGFYIPKSQEVDLAGFLESMSKKFPQYSVFESVQMSKEGLQF